MGKIIRRDRSANFSIYERDILVSLVQKYKAVLENKKNDGVTWKRKENAWEIIQKEFNARSGFIYRSTKTLKIKYEGLKRTVRKKSAALRSKLYCSGGGTNTPPPLDNVEEQIKAIISLKTDGLEGVPDCDILPQTQETQDPIVIPKVEEIMDIPPLQVDTAAAAAVLQSGVVESDATQNQVLLFVTNDCEPLPLTTSAETVPLEKNINLDTVNANELKNTLFDVLTQAKLELIQLQKRFLEAEIIEKKKVWEFEENERKKEAEFKEKERKWKEQEYKLKLGKNFK